MRPQTAYAKARGARIAYQVLGEGETDLVFVPGFVSHVELQWADPAYARFLRRLAAMSRLILFDKRGVGMSSGIRRPPSLEERVEDALAVLDAAGSRRPVVLGFSDGGSAAALMAAAHPDRCSALVLVAPVVRGVANAPPVGPTLEVLDAWGEGRSLDLFAPSLAGSALHRRSFGLFERASLDPEMARRSVGPTLEIDVSDALRAIDVPVLVLHRRGDIVPIEHGRETARLIPGARFVELDGADHLPYAGDPGPILTEVEGFLAAVAATRPATPPRRHAAVLFTDIVDSTRRLVTGGDAAWAETIAAHDVLVRAEVASRGGRVVKSTGDGVLAVFDGAVRATEAAWAVREQVRRLAIDVRCGVHAGEVDFRDGDVSGLTVHAAARVMGTAGAGEVVCSEAVRGLVADSGLTLEPLDPVELKGLPGRWRLHRLVGDPVQTGDDEPAPRLVAAALLDRVQVGFARRAPAVARSFARLAG